VPINEALRIRLAGTADLEAIRDIYNHYVLGSTCTYQNVPDTADERAAWFAAHDEAHPVTVAEQVGQVIGWGALSVFRGRWGYRHTVENSVYVHHEHHGRGIGRALLGDLIERARGLGHHTMVAGISADQTGSITLHHKFGFVTVGHLKEVGHKFGYWLDVVYVQKML
jgi:L-amino acid N-acyltransferase YncA